MLQNSAQTQAMTDFAGGFVTWCPLALTVAAPLLSWQRQCDVGAWEVFQKVSLGLALPAFLFL